MNRTCTGSAAGGEKPNGAAVMGASVTIGQFGCSGLGSSYSFPSLATWAQPATQPNLRRERAQAVQHMRLMATAMATSIRMWTQPKLSQVELRRRLTADLWVTCRDLASFTGSPGFRW
jgi:hypothetical protein